MIVALSSSRPALTAAIPAFEERRFALDARVLDFTHQVIDPVGGDVTPLTVGVKVAALEVERRQRPRRIVGELLFVARNTVLGSRTLVKHLETAELNARCG